MKITDVAKSKGTRYNIYVDDEYWYNLDLEIVMQNHLKISMEVDEEFLEDVMMQAERRKARERAYYLLGYRDHSMKELYDKLIKSARPEIAMDIIHMVQEQGLLDDEEYASKLARYYMLSKKWGAKKAYYEMLKKGIDKEIIHIAIDECDVDYVEQIKAIIEKKYYDCFDDYKSKQKLIAGLMRLGYAYDDIKTAMSEYQ